jgi:RecA-family ATPase
MDELEDAYMSDAEYNTRQLVDKMNFWPVPFWFLQEHRGFRPGKLHVFLGATSSGKSTLIRTIIYHLVDKLQEGKTILIWLSEEARVDFVRQLKSIGDLPKENLKRIKIVSEVDSRPRMETHLETLERFKMAVLGKDMVIIDNITTGRLYDQEKPQRQSEVAQMIKEIAVEKNIPVILMAHPTKAKGMSRRRMLQEEDIRGSKTLLNLAEFFYVIQQLKSKKNILSTLRIVKSRGIATEHKLYNFKHDKERDTYVSDEKSDYDEFKSWFEKSEQF